MNLKTIAAAFITMSLSGIPALCMAQDSASFPVLRKYWDLHWFYFAPAADESLVFGNWPHDDRSNAWIAIERATSSQKLTSPRRIFKKTDFWIDYRGVLHSLSVLTLQLDFNDYIQELERIGQHRPLYEYSLVDETGILDLKTLSIPYNKLRIRIIRMSERLALENERIAAMTPTDPGGAALQNKYASYWSEKISEASARTAELQLAIAAVPLVEAGGATPISRGTVRMDGLTGLDVPIPRQYFLTLVKVEGDPSYVSRLVPSSRMPPDESYTKTYADPAGLTSAVAANLKEKESAADKAVSFAESLCRDLMAPPCP